MENNKKFVIQEHTKAGDIHWDLMLEKSERLETYRLNIPPQEIYDRKAASAEKIFDHNLKFLTYEGSVNKGKGSVKIADKGFYKILFQTENEIHLCFNGEILRAGFCLKFVKDNLWQLEYENI